MANPSVVSLHLAAAVTNGVALAQTPIAAGPLTINGSLAAGGIATFDVARRLGISSSGNDAGVVFTVLGTSRSNVVQGEQITGVNASTVISVLDYLTITSITASAATVGSITAGTNGTGSTVWVVDDFLAEFWALAVACSITSGAATYTVEHTYDDPNKGPPSGSPAPYQWSMEASSFTPPVAWPNAVLQGATTSGETNYANQPIFAHRLTITAGTGNVTMQSIQAGPRS